jgi:hypothetical protein
MPDIQITDQLDQPVQMVTVELTNPSSLVTYLKTELLHLMVFPDFLAIKDDVLSQAAATKPIQFQAKASDKFQLGDTTPAIDLTPAVQAAIYVNASPGKNLFDNAPFPTPVTVPPATGYVGVQFQGSLDAGVAGSEGDFTFGFDAAGGVNLEYWKAFPLGAGEAKLGDALAATMGCYTIPVKLADLNALAVNDVALVSGTGSLKVSGGVSFSVSPNPLASVDLPLGAGTIAVAAGLSTGLSASFTLSGAYQIRARRIDADTLDLSIIRESGTAWSADLSASDGVTAKVAGVDLIGSILGAISTSPAQDQAAFAALKPADAQVLSDAIKAGLNHNLQASIDVVLAGLSDDQAAFQYQIQTAQLTPDASAAVSRALCGDLSLLTALEDGMQSGGALAPGLKLIESVMTETRKQGVTLKINLLGILNYLTVSELILHSETLTDDATGDVTIKETATGNRIVSIVDPLARNEALRKAIFDAVQATASYRAGKAVSLPTLDCSQTHFAINQNTSPQTMGDYLNWLVALNLLQQQEEAGILGQFTAGGPSTCVLRTSFGDGDCEAMFFDVGSNPHPQAFYLDIGRRAMVALLNPADSAIDGLRVRLLGDDTWSNALDIGANVNLGPLVGLSTGDPQVEYLIGDLLVIANWAEAMVAAGAVVQQVRALVGDGDPTSLFQNRDFQKKTAALQSKMAAMAKASTIRFDEPWGMVSLFWAGGSPRLASGKITAGRLIVARP